MNDANLILSSNVNPIAFSNSFKKAYVLPAIEYITGKFILAFLTKQIYVLVKSESSANHNIGRYYSDEITPPPCLGVTIQWLLRLVKNTNLSHFFYSLKRNCYGIEYTSLCISAHDPRFFSIVNVVSSVLENLDVGKFSDRKLEIVQKIDMDLFSVYYNNLKIYKPLKKSKKTEMLAKRPPIDKIDYSDVGNKSEYFTSHLPYHKIDSKTSLNFVMARLDSSHKNYLYQLIYTTLYTSGFPPEIAYLSTGSPTDRFMRIVRDSDQSELLYMTSFKIYNKLPSECRYVVGVILS